MAAKTQDAEFLHRALEVARRGVGLVSPGALVGAVVVNSGKIVGEGFYRYEQRKHAEVIAIERAGSKARGGTLYLNLEPCSHFGRTPPCADFVVAGGIRRVVCAMEDPNPLVAGKGFRKLRTAGIKVEVGLLADEAARLNEAFIRFITARQPFVTLKAAMTLDGKIALARQRRGSITWITSEQSRSRVQQLRHAHDALLVGVNTILKDDPLLTDRSPLPRRRRLLRVLLDAHLRTPVRSQIVKTAQDDVLLFCSAKAPAARRRQLEKHGVRVVPLQNRKGVLPWLNILRELAQRDIQSVMIEGGGETNGSALKAGIVDKLHLFIAPTVLAGHHVPAFGGAGFSSLHRAAKLRGLTVESIDGDLLVTGYLRTS